MFLNKHNLSIATLASKDSTRLGIIGLRVTPQGTVATDGKCLARVTLPQVDPEAWPRVDGTVPSTTPLEPCTIPASAAKELEKAIPKRPHTSVLSNALVDVEATNGKETFRAVASDVERIRPLTVRKCDEHYPDVDAVEKSRDQAPTTFTATFNAALLANVLKIAASITDDKDMRVTMEFADACQPVKIITSNLSTGQRATFLVMPCRSRVE